jgi:hypothetical protein
MAVQMGWAGKVIQLWWWLFRVLQIVRALQMVWAV